MRNKIELKNGVTLEVGKKYVHATWLNDTIYEVTAIGRNLFVYVPEGCDYELTHEIDNDWIPYEEKKEKWYEYLHLHNESEEETRYVLWYSNRPKLANVIYLREWDSKEDMIKDLKKC